MKAVLRNYRHSPRKVRQVANLVRGKTVANALAELSVLPKKAALPIEKLIRSAAAGARENFKTSASDIDLLIIKEVRVDDAVTLKRVQPAARGSAHPIRKRGSHVFISLSAPSEKASKKAVKKEVAAQKEENTEVKKAPLKKAKAKKTT